MAAPAVRLADFLKTLAYATDLATGQSRDFALHSCVLAMRLAEVMGLDDDMRRPTDGFLFGPTEAASNCAVPFSACLVRLAMQAK